MSRGTLTCLIFAHIVMFIGIFINVNIWVQSTNNNNDPEKMIETRHFVLFNQHQPLPGYIVIFELWIFAVPLEMFVLMYIISSMSKGHGSETNNAKNLRYHIYIYTTIVTLPLVFLVVFFIAKNEAVLSYFARLYHWTVLLSWAYFLIVVIWLRDKVLPPSILITKVKMYDHTV
jgi:hypothetical protein